MKTLPLKNILPPIVAIAACVAAVVFLVNNSHAPSPLKFGTLTLQSVMNVLVGLFVVALLAERAVEVMVSVVRDADAQALQNRLNAAIAANARESSADASLQKAVADAQSQLDDYRNDTKIFAACVGLCLGLAAAAAGVRGLHGLFNPQPDSRWFFGVDIVVTGATIAGGADGIHQMVNAVLDFFNMLSAQSNSKTTAATTP